MLSGAIARATTISSGGQEGVCGSAASAVARGGGILFVNSSATASGTILNGGEEIVSGFLARKFLALVNSGGLELVDNNGILTMSADGHGGTLVGDPPVLAQTDLQSTTLVNPHQACLNFGTNRTCSDVRFRAAFRSIPDIERV